MTPASTQSLQEERDDAGGDQDEDQRVVELRQDTLEGARPRLLA